MQILDDGPRGEYLTDRIGNEVVNFISKHQNEKFFAYVPFYSVHTPIQSKKEYQEKYLIYSLADFLIEKWSNKIEELNLS